MYLVPVFVINCSKMKVHSGYRIFKHLGSQLINFMYDTTMMFVVNEACTTKTDLLRSLLLSYQDKDWQAGPHQSILWFDTDYIVLAAHHLSYWCSRHACLCEAIPNSSHLFSTNFLHHCFTCFILGQYGNAGPSAGEDRWDRSIPPFSWLNQLVELFKSFHSKVKASKSVKWFQSYRRSKFCIDRYHKVHCNFYFDQTRELRD